MSDESNMVRLVKKQEGIYRIFPDGKEEIISQEQREKEILHLSKITDEESLQNALDDSDNPPLTDDQLKSLKPVYPTKIIRKKLDMNQEEFSKAFKIPLGTLRAWEQYATTPDATARAYLEVIEKNPEFVMRSLS